MILIETFENDEKSLTHETFERFEEGELWMYEKEESLPYEQEKCERCEKGESLTYEQEYVGARGLCLVP